MVKISLNSKIPKRRIAVVDRDLCTKEECGYQCIKVCPVNRSKRECITIDDQGYPVISEELCIGCGLCVPKCPVDAIRIINLDFDFSRTIHSYGVNSFRIYSLPLPRDRSIVGFVGRNGIGKSTVIGILAKKIIPNFDSGIDSWERAYERMTVEERTFFQSDRKVSIKPQNIELFRRSDVTVRELLDRMGIKLDSFRHLENRTLKDLSGGELQRLLIEISISQNADLFYLDEPTNFLDVFERLRYAIKIRDILDGKEVIVVDHDLAFLDYTVDYVYLFVGEEDVFGFASGIRSVRSGINEYLDGYLKAENFRFRDPIRFDDYTENEMSQKILVEYNEMDIDLGEFRLHVEPGNIRLGEVIGIVGRNGIGKTTFIREMVQRLGSMRIAYKPQYIVPDTRYVKDLNISSDLIEMFQIRRSILERRLHELSGGQLQKVYISYVLSQDADIYLLDEPTAYLDIENRMRLARLIRKYALEKQRSILIIDHDIMFIDRISHRIIVFDGEPGIRGYGYSPMDRVQGMNRFLSVLGITMRRDPDTKRPRINKPGSVLDREQRASGVFYS
ncbi:MAG: ribosome biogenesis/translation initiation ATPase RLI [Candidatus Micrarchaeota archaeon]|nr:ribosome biogenesis/translation initiation ATPase RLI [Candidatus Micrarchaeota archaeon]MCX8154748.1 ribosome biogenesis/translation initiation ATPase RLI [Candidatus Micrarchaeota archaeon]